MLLRRIVRLIVPMLMTLVALPGFAQSGIRRIVDTTMTAPPGGDFSSFGGRAVINDRGLVAFISANGVFTGDGTTFHKLFAVNDPAPGGGTFSLFGFGGGSLNNNGVYAFNDEVFNVPSLQLQAMYTTDGTTARRIIADGDLSPDGTPFRFIVNSSYIPAISDTGQVTFVSSTAGHLAHASLFRSDGTTSSIVALTGNAAPGGGTFLDFDDPAINGAGQTVFDATTTGGSSFGIFRYTGDTGTLLATRGETAPGGGQFRSFLEPSLSEDGRVAFCATTTGGPAQGIYLTDGAAIDRIAAVGETLPDGTLVQGFSPFTSINSKGHIAFATRNGLNNSAVIQGIYVAAASHITPVIALGNALFGSTVTQLGISHDFFNENDQLAFSYSLEDGREGVGLWEGPVITVSAPEPSAAGLLALLIPWAILRRRRTGYGCEDRKAKRRA